MELGKAGSLFSAVLSELKLLPPPGLVVLQVDGSALRALKGDDTRKSIGLFGH